MVLVALPGLAGCGIDDSSGNRNVDQIRVAMTDFSEAVYRQQYSRACEMFTRDAVDFFEAQTQIPGGCEGVVKAGYGSFTNSQLDDLGDVESVRINGDRATAELSGDDSVRFRKVDGEWKLSLD